MPHIRDEIERVLKEHGLGEEPWEFDSTIHSWRCAYPDRYGKCTCLTDLVNDLWEMVEQHEH